jgi:phage terminase large subunit GpA-like protein
LQVFINTKLAELWTETAEAVNASVLAARVEPLARDVVPLGVGALTAGADVQGNRIETYVWGWGAGLESWLIAHEIFAGDPERDPSDPDSPWPEFFAYCGRTFPTDTGHALPLAMVAVDTGFAATKVYRALQRVKSRRVVGVKGVGGAVPFLGAVKPQGTERVPVLPIGTDAAKNEWFRSHLPAPSGAGRVHLPDWLTTDQLEQLVGEKRRRRVVRGRPVYEWVPKTPEQPLEALDCRVYARGVLDLSGIPRTLADRAMKMAAPPESATPAPLPPRSVEGPIAPRRPAPLLRGGWVNRWNK